MKIYISALSLTIVVILHIHVSSSIQPLTGNSQPTSLPHNELASPTHNQLASPTPNQLASPPHNKLASPTPNQLASPAHKQQASPHHIQLASPTPNQLASPAHKQQASPHHIQLASPPHNQLTSPAHIHVASPPHNELSPGEPSSQKIKLPKENPNVMPHLPQPFFSDDYVLISIYHAGKMYKISKLETAAASENTIPKGSLLFRVGYADPIAIFNKNNFYGNKGIMRCLGYSKEIIKPIEHDFVTLKKEPVGYYSAAGFNKFFFND